MLPIFMERGYLGDVLDELVESLETRDLLNHEGELDLSKCTVEVTFDVDTSDGLQDPDLGAAVHALTGRRVLIDRTHVAGASVLHMNTTYPNASKYGVPEVATIQGPRHLRAILDSSIRLLSSQPRTPVTIVLIKLFSPSGCQRQQCISVVCRLLEMLPAANYQLDSTN